VLLSADAEPATSPGMIDGLGLIAIPPPAVEFGGMTAEATASDSGPRPPVAIGFASGSEWRTDTAVALLPLAIRTSSLLVQDDAGNSIWSTSGPDAATLNAPATTVWPQMPAGTDFSPAEGYGPQPEVGPPSPEELAATPRMPWTTSYSYTGSIDGMKSTALRIPVGPFTRTLTLGLTPQDEGEPFMPRIDQVFLIGRGGEMLSRITGVSILGDGPSQTLYISINGAPTGGEIVVRLVSMASLMPSGPAGQVTDGPDGVEETVDDEGDASPLDGTYFELSIRRNDVGAPGGGASATATKVSDGGTPYIVTLGRTDVSTAIGPLAPAAEPATTTASESGPGPRVAVSTTSGAADADVDLADEGPVVVYLGPLVSRTAAALGPVLATTSDEPTPTAGRGPRSQGGGLAAFGADLDLELILAVKARGDRGGPSDADPALTTLRGPGGVPIVVAGLGVGEGSRDADDLAASAVGAAQEEAPLLADALGSGADEAEVEVARAGLATRALGFLIGMGLASGPLYPDLIALARRKFRRRPRPARRRRTDAG